MSNFRPEVAVTAIIRLDDNKGGSGRYLLLKRAATKKRFPSMWTVPGGQIERQDYIYQPPNADGWNYGVVEDTLMREVLEEAGIHIRDIEYLCSMVMDNEKGQVLVLSMTAQLKNTDENKVTINPAESSDYAWASLDEARTIGLIEGIYDELVLAENRFRIRGF